MKSEEEAAVEGIKSLRVSMLGEQESHLTRHWSQSAGNGARLWLNSSMVRGIKIVPAHNKGKGNGQ